MTKIAIALLASTGFAAAAFANEGNPTERCETVLIETANGPVRINAEDFNAETMKLADSPEPPAPPVTDPAGAAGAAGAPVQRLVSSEGTGNKQRFYIVDEAGAKLTGEGIDPKGYATDGEVWAVITALNLADQSA